MAGVKCPRRGLFKPTAERCECGHQFVTRTVVSPPTSTGRSSSSSTDVALQRTNDFAEVTVVNGRMPFSSMVVFIVKWTIASIPALLILALLGFMLSAAVGGTLLTLSRGLE